MEGQFSAPAYIRHGPDDQKIVAEAAQENAVGGGKNQPENPPGKMLPKLRPMEMPPSRAHVPARR
jgi:hypothetical protein